jgi:hypothetical protein
VGSLKVRTFFILFALSLGLVVQVKAMPDCGVCAGSAPVSSEFRAQSRIDTFAFGEKKILYIRLCYPDDSAEPVTVAAAEALLREVTAFYRTNSFGQFWTAGTVTPLIQLPKAKATYFSTNELGEMTWSAFQMLADAREVARAAGFDYENYDFDVLRFDGPMWRSSANIGSRGAWLLTSNVATTIHEIGHNLGLHHANMWTGPLNGYGWNTEYGDEYDIMGNPLYFRQAGMHAIHKITLGWLKGSNVMEVKASGVYRLYAHDRAQIETSRKYLLRVRKDEERDYWLEKRGNFDVYEHMEKSGLLAYWDSWAESNHGTHLLDPTTDEGESLRIGTALRDEATGVRIIPLAQAEDYSYVDVAVIFGKSRLNMLPGMLHVMGEAGVNYEVQVSSDLRAWSALAQVAEEDIFVLLSAGTPRAFYRVIPEPERR